VVLSAVDVVTPRQHARSPLTRAEIIAVGSELLTTARLDTNSLTIAETLGTIGIAVDGKAVVGDDEAHVAARVAQALERADLVVLTGGLGPTDDDVTRDAVATVLGRRLHEDAAIVEQLEKRFASRGLTMPVINRRQALVIDGAVVLDNPLGTAPGQFIEVGDRVVVLLPGPPREMAPMLRTVVRDHLERLAGPTRILTRTIVVTGRTESHAEEALRPCYAGWRTWAVPVDATILAADGRIELQLRARGLEDAATDALARAQADVQAALGSDVVSLDGQLLEQVVGELLVQRGWRIAVAESCTGGLLASRLTDIPGSSAYVQLGVVAYSNAAKTDLLDVPPALIAEHGAVSEPVALAMAHGARARAKSEIGVGVTGIAGPTGGTEAKPVGTVAIAVAGPDGVQRVRTVRFPGDRVQVKRFASQAALDMVRRLLLRVSQADR
jgi:nicotinamide-nucleotide amidase